MVSKATPRSSRARRNCSPNAVAPPACAMSLSFEAATRPYHKRSHALNQRNLPVFRRRNLPGTLLLQLSGHCLEKLLAGCTAAPAPTPPGNRGYTGIAPGQGGPTAGRTREIASSGRMVGPMKPGVVKARSLARKTGAIRLINSLRPARSYEQRAHQALTAALRPGDVAWEVGANVGLSTELDRKSTRLNSSHL